MNKDEIDFISAGGAAASANFTHSLARIYGVRLGNFANAFLMRSFLVSDGAKV